MIDYGMENTLLSHVELLLCNKVSICLILATDIEYIDTRQCFFEGKTGAVVIRLWASVVKRYYLLKMKAKYAG